jgi:hypothetical protein
MQRKARDLLWIGAGAALVLGFAVFFVRVAWDVGASVGPLFVGVALSLIMSWVLTIVAVLVIILFGIGLVALAIVVVFWAGSLAANQVGAKIDQFQKLFKKTSRENARDANVMAILAVLAALVLFASTNDFFEVSFSEKHEHGSPESANAATVIKLLGVISVVLVMGKLSLLIPMRLPKVLGLTAIAIGVLGIAACVVTRYPSLRELVVSGSMTGQTIALACIAALDTFSIGYPFTLRGWGRLLHAE